MGGKRRPSRLFSERFSPSGAEGAREGAGVGLMRPIQAKD